MKFEGNVLAAEPNSKGDRTRIDKIGYFEAQIMGTTIFCKNCAFAVKTRRGAHYCQKHQKYVAKKYGCELYRAKGAK